MPIAPSGTSPSRISSNCTVREQGCLLGGQLIEINIKDLPRFLPDGMDQLSKQRIMDMVFSGPGAKSDDKSVNFLDGVVNVDLSVAGLPGRLKVKPKGFKGATVSWVYETNWGQR